MRVEFHAAAAREVEGAQAWYEERSMFAAAAVLRELSIATQRIREAPMRYAPAEHGTRRILLERFPVTLYYRIREEVVTIVAVAHQKRRPGYWQAQQGAAPDGCDVDLPARPR
jgi:plasmid stabilization system protein ParE